MTPATFTIDSEFRDLLPPLSEDERTKLMMNCNANGIREPLVVWKEFGILIDGHNRFDISNELDLDYEVRELSFKSREAVKLWMLNNQLGRRNLTDAMRVEICLKVKPAIEEQAKANRAASGGDRKSADYQADKSVPMNSSEPIQDEKPVDTRAEIARMSGVSPQTVSRVEKVLSTAPDEVKEQMRTGAISVNKAFQSVRPGGTKPSQSPRKRAADGPEETWLVISDRISSSVDSYVKRCPGHRGSVAGFLHKLANKLTQKGKSDGRT